MHTVLLYVVTVPGGEHSMPCRKSRRAAPGLGRSQRGRRKLWARSFFVVSDEGIDEEA